jgi:hypothetical protein
VHLASTQVFDRHSTFQGRPPMLRKVFTSVPQQPFNFRWNLSTANGGLQEIRRHLPTHTCRWPSSGGKGGFRTASARAYSRCAPVEGKTAHFLTRMVDRGIHIMPAHQALAPLRTPKVGKVVSR